MTAAKATTAAIYCRISDDRNADEAGVQRQLSDCRAAVKQLRGAQLIGEFADNDISASKGKARPQYQQLLALVASGEVNTIVAYKLDRLYRSLKELEALIDHVESHSITIIAVAGGKYDLNTADGRAFARVVCSMATMEVDNIAARVKRKHLAKSIAGTPAGGQRPFGWHDDRVTINPAEAAVIKEAVKRVLAGESTLTVIADFNQRDLPMAARATRWRRQALESILKSSRLHGVRAMKGEPVMVDGKPVRGTWAPIIDDKTHARLLAILNSRHRTVPAVAHGGARRHPLTGFLVCALCGVKLVHGSTKDKGRRYTCRRDEGGCGSVSVKAEYVETMLFDAILSKLDVKRTTKAARATNEGDEAQALAELQAARDRLDELAVMFGDGEIDRRSYQVAKQRADAAAVDAERHYTALSANVVVGSIMASNADLTGQWEGFTLDQKRSVIGAAIERVDVHPSRSGARFNPDRVQVVWR